jgi:hypothetical protein
VSNEEEEEGAGKEEEYQRRMQRAKEHLLSAKKWSYEGIKRNFMKSQKWTSRLRDELKQAGFLVQREDSNRYDVNINQG